MSPTRVMRVATLLLFVGFLALLGIVGMTLWLAARSQSHFEAVLAARAQSAAAVELRNALKTAESSQRGYLASGNEIYLAPYSTAETAIGRHYDDLAAQVAGEPGAAALLARLKQVVADKLAEMAETIARKRSRDDAAALAILRTNRGKALMDEANVFLSSVIRKADERLGASAAEQQESAALLRIATLAGGGLIVLVVGAVIGIIFGYARNLARARDEVADLNTGLEARVAERTADLEKARDRAEVLLAEVNHRVANSLAIVSSMVRLQARGAASAEVRDMLAETQARITAVAQVHKSLYTSGDARIVALEEYLPGLLSSLESTLQGSAPGASLRQDLEPMRLPVDKSVGLGVIATEWITNAFKYAYPQGTGEVRVSLKRVEDGQAELVVEDDGIGRSAGAGLNGRPRGTGLGTQLVTAMAASIGGKVEYLDRRPGTAARLTLAAMPA